MPNQSQIHYVIENIYFVISISLATSYLTFLTTKGNLTKDMYLTFWSRFTKRGIIALSLLLLIVTLAILQEINHQFLIINNDTALKNERNIKDSLISNGISSGVETNSIKLFNKLSLAFSKQNLKIDTLKNTVIKLKDSLNTTINNYSQEDPLISIEGKGVKIKSIQNNNYDYELNFKSTNAGSTNFKIEIYILFESYINTYYLFKPDLLSNIRIPKNGLWTTGFQINMADSIKNTYLYLEGNYTTLDGVKSYPINEVYIYEQSNKMTWTLLNPKRNKIISQIKLLSKKIVPPSTMYQPATQCYYSSN